MQYLNQNFAIFYFTALITVCRDIGVTECYGLQHMQMKTCRRWQIAAFHIKVILQSFSKICSNLKALQLKVALLALIPLCPLLKTRIHLIETWEEM